MNTIWLQLAIYDCYVTQMSILKPFLPNSAKIVIETGGKIE